MHQTPRPTVHTSPQRTSSRAGTPHNNSAKANDPRDPRDLPSPAGQPVLVSDAVSNEGSAQIMVGTTEAHAEGGPTRDSIKKLDQIIQNLYSKAGTLILQERMQVTPALVGKTKRTSRWFQLDTDDIDDFREEFRVWKTCGGFENRPPPLVIETYLDASRLKSGQSLVALDENGKRWDVIEAINADQSSESSTGRQGKFNTHVVLERWRIELKGAPADDPEDFGPLLPTVYKKAIVLIRSIYATTGILPAWKLARNSKTRGIHPALTTRCRVYSGDSRSFESDTLRTPLFESRVDVITDYMFGDLEVPVGRFYVSVAYRNQCAFQVVETESLLSSRIGLAISDDMFKPSLPHRSQRQNELQAHEVGSLPHQRHLHNIIGNHQRYGSMSTFHGEGPLGTSPISALRAVRAPGSDTSSPTDSRPASIETPGYSLPVSSIARRASLRTTEGLSRRPSVSFQSSPFKHGSLSGSPVPRTQDQDIPPSPRTSVGNTATHVRNRPSLTAGMPSSLRGAPMQTAADNSVTGSPRPANTNRFSSSFTHRRNRPSLSGTSRGDDDQMSSGKQSVSSSIVQPGSGLLNEIGGAASSGSFQTDDDGIQEFLKALESKRTLQSFESTKKTGGFATKRTTAQLSKFQLMRESNNALTESMNCSVQLQRPSTASSRQLPNLSISSLPGKPLSPHTPHTPAIPSRLSENSSVDYTAPVQTTSQPTHEGDPVDGSSASNSGPYERTTAIDIPLSPRPYPHGRRPSSIGHQPRLLPDDDDAEAKRSLSLGAEDREVPSLSGLLRQRSTNPELAAVSPTLQPSADIRAAGSVDTEGQTSSSAEREVRPPGGLFSGLSGSPYSRRYAGSAGRGVTPPHSGSGSLIGSYGRYGRGNFRGSVSTGGGGSMEETEDEPLLFDMSEINRDQSRRSLEEHQSSSRNANSNTDRASYDSGRGRSRW
ncbi:hypothetical protein GGR50DRAFT_135640 [Xylaria sp. CBS 124048]|nr:hypothetical protein GGR50DRAFT_135640 [Xylaria sp. CBS 124048]